MTFIRLMTVEMVVAARMSLAPAHSNVPTYRDFSVDSCIVMLMSMI